MPRPSKNPSPTARCWRRNTRSWKGAFGAILSPASGATFLTGAWLLYITGAWRLPWFHVKLAFLVALFIYHGASNRFRLDLQAGKTRTVRFFRFWNESATILLFAIVFTVKFKTPMGAVYGLLAVLVITAVGMAFFLRARGKRNRV
jgi:putative membrane protein